MDNPGFDQLSIYVFSFNRGQFLQNCLTSIEHCAKDFEVTVIDDQSDDVATLQVLKNYRNFFRILTAGNDSDPEHKTGGLYNNMRFAFADARKREKMYVIFLQDDMQLVRPIMRDDISTAYRFFEANPNAAQLYTCFMKRFFADTDEALVRLDDSGEAYLRPSDYPGFSGFSAVGLFDIARFDRLFGELRKGEYANNEYAQKNNIQMGLSTRPFMMWLPYPISYRGKIRNIALQLVEGLAGCGFYPYDIMEQKDVEQLLSRDKTKKPYAEDYLRCTALRNVPVWSFAGGLSNLKARGGLRLFLGKVLDRIKKLYISFSK